MKKTFIAALMLSVLAIGAFANGDGENDGTKPFVLTLGNQDAPTHVFNQALEAASTYLEEISDGTMKIELYPSSQLGDFKATTAQVMEGELDMAGNGYPDMSFLIPELQVIGAPYVVGSYEHLLKILESDYGKKMDAAMVEKGIRMIDCWYFGTRQTTLNKPVESIEDLNGVKLRTPDVDFLVAYAQAVGAIASPIAFSELYLSLQTNQVDGQENPLPTINANKFYEIQKHIALTNHFIATKAILVSEKTWQKMNDQQREWLTEAIHYAREINNSAIFEEESGLIEELESERGVTFYRPDLAPFKAGMKPYYDKLEARFGDGIVSELQSLE
ncbi:MAG: sialic acid TRAP transporter substrate-binding protein SiaP [Spirochaetales bacterium]|nr:sialic acid TRAP transporter substrate-binding protein SiaP [Spirochaetales bacterium]